MSGSNTFVIRSKCKNCILIFEAFSAAISITSLYFK